MSDTGDLYKVEAIIRPNRLEAVQEALEEIGAVGLTAIEVRGVGRQKAVKHTFRGSQYSSGLSQRVKIEVILNGPLVDPAVEAICAAAHTGEVGDGKVLVYSLSQVVRIRTGERGATAL